jgi:hypothetical protein
MTQTDDTLDPTSLASDASDGTYTADAAAAAAIGDNTLSAVESAEKVDIDLAQFLHGIGDS